MTEIYLHFMCAHYGLYGNVPVPSPIRLYLPTAHHLSEVGTAVAHWPAAPSHRASAGLDAPLCSCPSRNALGRSCRQRPRKRGTCTAVTITITMMRGFKTNWMVMPGRVSTHPTDIVPTVCFEIDGTIPRSGFFQS